MGSGDKRPVLVSFHKGRQKSLSALYFIDKVRSHLKGIRKHDDLKEEAIKTNNLKGGYTLSAIVK